MSNGRWAERIDLDSVDLDALSPRSRDTATRIGTALLWGYGEGKAYAEIEARLGLRDGEASIRLRELREEVAARWPKISDGVSGSPSDFSRDGAGGAVAAVRDPPRPVSGAQPASEDRTSGSSPGAATCQARGSARERPAACARSKIGSDVLADNKAPAPRKRPGARQRRKEPFDAHQG